jgi:endonuclease YncB( thermonuclease family)
VPEKPKDPFDFRRALKANKRRKLSKEIMLGMGAFSIVFAAGMLALNWPVGDARLEGAGQQPPTLFQQSDSPQFAICGTVRRTCVVDGDTFWLDGTKIRIADIDTPEIGRPRCDLEYELGMRATRRLVDLLND